MGALISLSVTQTITFQSFGVRVSVTGDTPEVLERIPAMLPPDARPPGAGPASESFGLLAEGDGSYRFTRGGSPVSTGLELEFALMLLEHQLRTYIGMHAAGRIFVHAGVVAHEGRAIVLPGLSFAGKTTLVLELVRAGASYYSDEFAVIDQRGLVHPYAMPPSIRGDSPTVRCEPAGGEPLPIGMVVLTSYRPGAEWNPRTLSAARGVLAMIANALAVLQRSEETVRILSRAIDGALILEGERGEAGPLAPRLLQDVL